MNSYYYLNVLLDHHLVIRPGPCYSPLLQSSSQALSSLRLPSKSLRKTRNTIVQRSNYNYIYNSLPHPR